ncbi:major pollen allergen Ole e 10 isoform X2 [Vitis vinifera]|uniref:major pollen allergen Ole e 10 isoform X2 n=1 Tax=Vitis vinifera TaxID=29760 RepID=UPI000540269B|nr:major pollen allergen Ole e 10 isoform X2 [Vitis vinifera]|eukprot:XP_010650340.1 PREDICTED: major pollen allergen Ole e 10 isoform X2 [Vitis vinifera]
MAALAKVVAIMIASMAILATVAGGATPVIGPTPVVGGGTTQIPAEGGASWCVARSDASEQGLQTALDYACGSGADCTPIQTSGLCYLPNTLQAHASYAFNSFFQRKSMAPGSCDFAGTANIARTDPSYGSCVYPSSLSFDIAYLQHGRRDVYSSFNTIHTRCYISTTIAD